MYKVEWNEHQFADYLKQNGWDKTDKGPDVRHSFSNFMVGEKLLATVIYDNEIPKHEIWIPDDL
jgi:hypothetical protein